MAEGEGFEPSVRSRAQRFSRPPRSATPAPLRNRGAAGSHWDKPAANGAPLLAKRRRAGKRGLRRAAGPDDLLRLEPARLALYAVPALYAEPASGRLVAQSFEARGPATAAAAIGA